MGRWMFLTRGKKQTQQEEEKDEIRFHSANKIESIKKSRANDYPSGFCF
jgi:hypothetical protein